MRSDVTCGGGAFGSPGRARRAPPLPLRGYLPEKSNAGMVREPAREIPVLTECDVAVFGGGPAGVCAAAAAARCGRRTVLVERYGFLGGMATAANVTILHSLYGTDKKTKIIGGLPDEIIRRLQRAGAAYNGDKDGETSHWVICTETTKFVLDDVVIGSGAKILFHTLLTGVIAEGEPLAPQGAQGAPLRRDGRRVTAAIVEGKSGRQAIIAHTYIDCTGDADLVRRAGLETQLGDAAGRCQAPSLCFRVRGKGPDALPFEKIQAELFKTPMDYNGERYPTLLWGSAGARDKEEIMMAGVRVLNVNAADTLDLTRAEVEGRYQLRWILKRLQTMPGWQNVHLTDIATQIGIRETHRILADHLLTRQEALHGKEFGDVIAQGTYPIDIHTPDAPGILFENLDGTTRHIAGDRTMTRGRWDGQAEGAPPRTTLCYQVPYRCLIPRDLDNVLVAGRCIGATHESAGAIRVMINCMQFGQAAGTAAAMSPPGGGGVREVNVRKLQARLVKDGVPLRITKG